MCGKFARRGRLSEGGFTLVELLVYLIVAVIVVAGVYQLLIGQQRLYMKQRELQDVRTSLRSAANLLAFELRQASATGGDIYSIGTYEIKLRSQQGAGVVCAHHETQPRVGLYRTWGDIQASAADSAFIFAAGDRGTADDAWLIGSINAIWDPSAGGVPACDWGNSATPDMVAEILDGSLLPDKGDGEIMIVANNEVAQGATITLTVSHPSLTCSEFDNRAEIKIDADKWKTEGTMTGCTVTVDIPSDAKGLKIEIKIESDLYAQLSHDITGKSEWKKLDAGSGNALDYVRLGAPFRAFRAVEYGLYFDAGGRWWLGHKVGDAADYERLTGPLSAPSDSGLIFIYYDQNGDTTNIPTAVRMVDIILRGESYGKAPQAGELGPQVEEDTLTVRVSLRG